MTQDEHDSWAEKIVQELLDPITAKEWGEEAGFRLALELGLLDGDAVELNEDSQVILATPLEEIEANIQRARDAKARGVPMSEHLAG